MLRKKSRTIPVVWPAELRKEINEHRTQELTFGAMVRILCREALAARKNKKTRN